VSEPLCGTEGPGSLDSGWRVGFVGGLSSTAGSYTCEAVYVFDTNLVVAPLRAFRSDAALEGADERDHPGRRLMPGDGEPRVLQPVDDDDRREPQLAIDTFAEVPPVRLPNPDEIMDLDSDGLVIEKAAHDQVVGAAKRDETIQLQKLSTEIAKREDKPASGGEAAGRALEYPVQVFDTLKVGKRVAHASRTTTGRALTCRSTRMRPTAGQLSGRNSAESSRFAKSAASTIATSDGRPDGAQPVHDYGDPRVRPLAPTFAPFVRGGPWRRGPRGWLCAHL